MEVEGKMTKPSNRIGLFLAVSCVLSLGLVLGVEGTDAGAQQQVEMRVATVAPEGTPWEQQLRRFKSNIEQASGGRIRGTNDCYLYNVEDIRSSTVLRVFISYGI